MPGWREEQRPRCSVSLTHKCSATQCSALGQREAFVSFLCWGALARSEGIRKGDGLSMVLRSAGGGECVALSSSGTYVRSPAMVELDLLSSFFLFLRDLVSLNALYLFFSGKPVLRHSEELRGKHLIGERAQGVVSVWGVKGPFSVGGGGEFRGSI